MKGPRLLTAGASHAHPTVTNHATPGLLVDGESTAGNEHPVALTLFIQRRSFLLFDVFPNNGEAQCKKPLSSPVAYPCPRQNGPKSLMRDELPKTCGPAW